MNDPGVGDLSAVFMAGLSAVFMADLVCLLPAYGWFTSLWMVYQPFTRLLPAFGWLAGWLVGKSCPPAGFKFLFAQIHFHGKILIIKGPSAPIRLCRARRGLRDMIKTLPETMKGGRYDQH